MIEAKIDTIVRGAKCVGEDLPVKELASRQRRVKEAKTKPRYCENPECRVLKLTGERQRLRGLNGVVVDKGVYQGIELSRVCSWCEAEEVVSEEPEEIADPAEKCPNGHVIAEVGRSKKKQQCRQCQREYDAQRAHKRRTERVSGQIWPGRILLWNLTPLKEKWGGSFERLAAESGCSSGSIKHWAALSRSTTPENAEKLGRVLGCTVADLSESGGIDD